MNSNSERAQAIVYWILLGIILLIVICVRIRLLGIPLERDEGEYAYCGQLLLQMVPPYKAAYTMKLPGACFFYALIMSAFGQTIKGIHLGLLFVNCLSIIFLFLIARKLLNPRAALIAAGSFAILAVSPTVLGFAAHATHFMVLAALAGAWLLLVCLENGRLILFGASGFLFGMAFLMKQQGIFFPLWGGFLILQAGLGSKPMKTKAMLQRLLSFSTGALVPLLAVVGITLLTGTFNEFWFWTFKYSAVYARANPLSWGMQNLHLNLMDVVNGFALLWIMAVLGLLVLIFDRRFRDIRWFILSFTLFSILSVSIGLYFRNHYFVLLLPVASLLIGIFIDAIKYYISQRCSYKFIISIPLLVFLSVVVLGIKAHGGYFLYEKPETLVKSIHGPNPFLESLKIAEFLRTHTKPGDKVGVLGSEPQIFFYAHRKSATGYIYVFELMGDHDYSLAMQKEMIAEIERASPKFLVMVRIIYSWLMQPSSKRFILTWFHDYAAKHYDLVGKVDIMSAKETRYLWGDAAQTDKNAAPFALLIYERRPAAH
jgi:hypothetical protein